MSVLLGRILCSLHYIAGPASFIPSVGISYSQLHPPCDDVLLNSVLNALHRELSMKSFVEECAEKYIH